MSSYFGDPWPSDVCDTGLQVDTPLGQPCLLCSEAVQLGDQGIFLAAVHAGGIAQYEPVHRECNLRSVLGGIEHLTAGPHAAGACYAGSTLTYRESSRQAWDWWMAHGSDQAILSGLQLEDPADA